MTFLPLTHLDFRFFPLILFVVFRIRRSNFKTRKQFRYKLLPYYLVNPAIKISLLTRADGERLPAFFSPKYFGFCASFILFSVIPRICYRFVSIDEGWWRALFPASLGVLCLISRGSFCMKEGSLYILKRALFTLNISSALICMIQGTFWFQLGLLFYRRGLFSYGRGLFIYLEKGSFHFEHEQHSFLYHSGFCSVSIRGVSKEQTFPIQECSFPMKEGCLWI